MEREELLALGVEETAVEKILEEQERLRGEYDDRLNAVKNEYEIEKILRESGARNIKAVRALIENGGAEDVMRQVEMLKRDEETRFLFEKKGSFAPYRSPEKLPDTKRDGYEQRLGAARKAGNTVEAIRIKQEAASRGIMLL